MKYLYYTLYRLLLRVKTNKTPDWSAMLLISLLVGANILTISLLLPKSMQKQYETKDQVIFAAAGIAIVVMVINYLVLVTNTPKLCIKYKDETESQKRRGVVLLLLYALCSILSVYFVSNYVNG